jgi:putative hydrolase of the HAD superfamily
VVTIRSIEAPADIPVQLCDDHRVALAAVIFDFFGTLTPGTPGAIWDQHAALSAGPLGIPAATWRRALDESWEERATGRLGGLAETFRALAIRCGTEPDAGALAAACAARRTCQRELFRLRPEAERTLAAVRAHGVPIGVLSDCSVELSEAWTALPVAELVDARVLSCEEGRLKPDPELFRLVAGRLSTPPDQCLYVGDGGGHELTGARACGMTPYMLRARDWGDSQARNREDSWPGPYLTSLAEVLPVLGLGAP